MTRYVIRNCGSLMDNTLIGFFLAAYDPDGMEGFGLAAWDPDVDKALRFDSTMEAIKCWQQTSTVRPLRPDGRPNRPLTAYSIEPVPLTAKGHPKFPPLFQREDL